MNTINGRVKSNFQIQVLEVYYLNLKWCTPLKSIGVKRW